MRASTEVGAPGAVRVRGGGVFAVDGRRQGTYPRVELTLDGTEATLRLNSRLQPQYHGERVMRQDEIGAIVVNRRWFGPYVELVGDVRTHGLTRFDGGPNVVEALCVRGWPVSEDRP